MPNLAQFNAAEWNGEVTKRLFLAEALLVSGLDILDTASVLVLVESVELTPWLMLGRHNPSSTFTGVVI